MGLSDREDDGEGEGDEMETLEIVEETEGGRADMGFGDEIRLLGVQGFDGLLKVPGVSGRDSESWDWDGMVLSSGIDRSERERGRRMVDQNGPVELEDRNMASLSHSWLGVALCALRVPVLVPETVRESEAAVGL